MQDVITINKYEEFRQKFDSVMQETAERFVVIGYLLKVARDTDILKESGYSSMGEFALKRYGLTKDIASRYIAINDRYSEGGYSEKLDSRYKEFGYAKLAEMLTLPDVIVEEIAPEMTKEEIRVIKSEVREEENVSDIEVILEEKDPEVGVIDSTIGKVLYQICYEHPEVYEKLWVAVQNTCDIEDLSEILAPSGIALWTCRIPGAGRLMLSVKGMEEALVIINVREERKEEVSWEELRRVAVDFMKKYSEEYQNWKNCWEKTFQEFLPLEKTEVAPVQQKKVVKSVPKPVKSASKSTPKISKSVPEMPESIPEEQIPGQMEVSDYPEVVPKVNYQEVKEAAVELVNNIYDVFWVWKEKEYIPKDEIEAVKDNIEKLMKKVNTLIELAGETVS